MNPYAVKNPVKVKASETKKNHIISLPYSAFMGSLPPDQDSAAAGCAILCCGIMVFIARAKLAQDDQKPE
jgi:hypothetical protein